MPPEIFERKPLLVEDIRKRIDCLMEQHTFTDGENPKEVRDAECELICTARDEEIANLISDMFAFFGQ